MMITTKQDVLDVLYRKKSQLRELGVKRIGLFDYFGVDYEIVWDVVENKISALHQDILKILKREETI